MKVDISWSDEATSTFMGILGYLEDCWTQREVDNFIDRVEEVTDMISKNPMQYPKSKSKGVYRAVVSKQTSLYYYYGLGEVVLLSFEDNRRDPKKLKY